MKKNTALSRILLLTALASSTTVIHAQAPLDAEDGIDFGNGANDPYIGKALTSEDLEIRLGLNSALKLFTGTNTQPSFIAAQGHEASVPSAGWYRIAQCTSAGKRANAKFTLNDNINGGGHSTAVFYAGLSYGDESEMSVTLLSHNRYSVLTFSKIRIVERGTYDHFYLEVKVDRPGAVRFAISENLSADGWQKVDWTPSPTIPAGYTAKEYDIDKLFMVGDTQSRFSIDRGGEASIQGNKILTSESGLNSSATGDQAIALGKNSQASGIHSFALAYSTASGDNSIALGGLATGYGSLSHGFSTTAGAHSVAFGLYNTADGLYSTAIGGFAKAIGNNSFALSNAEAVAIRSVALPNSRASSYLTLTTGNNAPRFTEAGKTTFQGDNLNSAFEVGIGSADNDRKNGLTVLQDGSVEIGHNSTDATIPLHIKADGSVILSKPQGDISMGIYGN